MIYNFRDSTSLAKWTKLSIYAQIAISLVAIVSGYLEYEMLTALQNGTFESQQAAVNAAEASDSRQGLVGIAQLLIRIQSMQSARGASNNDLQPTQDASGAVVG